MRLLIALFFVCSVSCQAAAGIPAILEDKKGVKDIIREIRVQFQEAIRAAGSEARVTLTHAFYLTELMIQNVEKTYEKSLNITFDKIDDQQQKLISDLNDTVLSFSRAINNTIEDINSNLNLFNLIVANGYFSNKPIVSRVHPLYIAPSGVSDEIIFNISGARLHHSTHSLPVLKINGTSYTASDHKDGEIKFVVPRSKLPKEQKKVSTISAELVTTYPAEGWRRFLPWSNSDSASIQILLSVLPERIGRGRISSQFENKQAEVREYRMPDNKLPRRLVATGGSGGPTDSDCFVPKSPSRKG